MPIKRESKKKKSTLNYTFRYWELASDSSHISIYPQKQIFIFNLHEVPIVQV